MVKTVKMLAVMAVLVIAAVALCGCGENNPVKKIENVKGTVEDAGNVKALCPEGWYNYIVEDMFADEDAPDKRDHDALQFMKDVSGVDAWDILMKKCSYITIDCLSYGWLNEKNLYDDAIDVALTVNDREWKGFTGTSISSVYTILYNDDMTIRVMIFGDGTKSGKLNYDDVEVQAILNSIVYTPAKD